MREAQVLESQREEVAPRAFKQAFDPLYRVHLEEDVRLANRDRLIGFNAILADLVAEFDASDGQHYWHYSNVTYDVKFDAEHVSEIDCFHPSAEGQALIAEGTWNAGPFATP